MPGASGPRRVLSVPPPSAGQIQPVGKIQRLIAPPVYRPVSGPVQPPPQLRDPLRPAPTVYRPGNAPARIAQLQPSPRGSAPPVYRPNRALPPCPAPARASGVSQLNSLPAANIRIPDRSAIQRVIVNNAGGALRPTDVQELRDEHPGQLGEINAADVSSDSFRFRSSRHTGITFTPYSVPKKRDFYRGPPEGYSVTYDQPTTRNAARAIGADTKLERKDFARDFTQQILQSPFGARYEGAGLLQSGKGLKESGLDRTHHLADSSILVIVQWLHNNRGWQLFGSNWVKQWMAALTGADGSGPFDELSDPRCTTRDLERIAHTLSASSYQVGIGKAEINQKVIGSHFDASRTPGGFYSPVSSVIAQCTEGLLHVGVPAEIIRAALSEVVDPSGKPVSSMIVHGFGKFGNPPSGPPSGGSGGGWGRGGGSGGGITIFG